MKLLKAPDKSRYVFYNRNKTLKFNAQYERVLPQSLTKSQEKALADALAQENFFYLEETVRKFLDDLNGMKI